MQKPARRKTYCGKPQFIVANFKMNKTNAEIEAYFSAFPKIPKDFNPDVVFCPPATGLHLTSKLINRPKVHLGVQNIHFESHGAFTGEISAEMAADCGSEFVLVGHSERRGYFGEDDSIINKKVAAALRAGLTVILCIGETGEEHGEGRTKNVLSRQINEAVRGIADINKIIIAYEPIWAVGRGMPAEPDEIKAAAADIRKIIKDMPILYGGSVSEENAGEILAIDGIDGVLVGGACLDPRKFAEICGLT
jgi:triosephosphate isomerase